MQTLLLVRHGNTHWNTKHLIQGNGEGNTILTAPHPATETYSGRTAGFLSCNHFKIVNSILDKQHKQQINW